MTEKNDDGSISCEAEMKAKKTQITRIKKIILLTLRISLLTIIPFSYFYITRRSFQPFETNSIKHNVPEQACDIFRGNWVPHLKRPYYTNLTKCKIDDRQNCMKFGRPDTDFLYWRWKPDECDLPQFDAKRFLELVRGKSMAFIGDSVGRNQLESLMCLLSNVASPIDIPYEEDTTKRWLYKDFKFMVALVWSPSLVKLSLGNPNISSVVGVLNLYLDKVDEKWAAQIKTFNYVIISSGHWFSRPLIYHQEGGIIGCHDCKNKNITSLTKFFGYRMAIRTTFRTLLSLKNFKGVTFFRTFSPTHFGHEDWEKGGNCSSTRPNKMKLEANILEFYSTQRDEFREAEREGAQKGLKFKLLDVTQAMGMRPDGHPYIYGHPRDTKERVADCLHWCLPGPIDFWNELLLHMLKVDDLGSKKPRLAWRSLSVFLSSV